MFQTEGLPRKGNEAHVAEEHVAHLVACNVPCEHRRSALVDDDVIAPGGGQPQATGWGIRGVETEDAKWASSSFSDKLTEPPGIKRRRDRDLQLTK
ncbi:hypothetical protein Asi02nite_37260 [Asanoa siamensis]|uniref:Uncharacterized protein n=1 Tax=Asanoa siamensis TaxID=926357 RepID=A0ABQ4CSF8_9ACTN|nr:hypothetical protein Asi02nite_37260 [Asanoa siamensis]